MWDWFFETIEMVYHPRLNEELIDNEFEVIEEESRNRANAVGGSEEDLSSIRTSKEPLQSVEYNEEIDTKEQNEKIEFAIDVWKSSNKTQADFMTLLNGLIIIGYNPDDWKRYKTEIIDKSFETYQETELPEPESENRDESEPESEYKRLWEEIMMF